MSTSYRAAVRTGLPHATIVVDHFHVVQLANKMLSTVRHPHHRHPAWSASTGHRPRVADQVPTALQPRGPD
ncbi:transposase [Streptomyces sp. 6-11-2]|uniref:transposase n=1 Tax=Streptomyces sp. 6-11-2 TaxID=2585753 RepID=UPI0011439267